MIKVLTVFGTRPEVIKLAPVIKQLEIDPQFISKTCAVAQHREMLDDHMLRIFKIKPDYDLNIMQKNQDLFHITSSAITAFKSVLKKVKPDLVLVQGDTTAAFAAALASFYLKTKVGHIEAGLRTDRKYEPFPEEMNRKLLTAISDFHFAPTKISKNNLLKENVDRNKIFITGNTVVDALKMILKETDELDLHSYFKINSNKRFILVTAHRRENVGPPLLNICNALKEIARINDIEIIFPVHLNPVVKKAIFRNIKKIKNIYLIDPLDYSTFVYLLKKSFFVLTDSGGIQEEASSLGKPVLIMRNVTERPEIIGLGNAILVGTEKINIIREATKLIRNKKIYQKMAKKTNVYGDGKAALKIKKILIQHFKE